MEPRLPRYPRAFLACRLPAFFPRFFPPSSLPRMRRGSSKPARLPPFFCSLGVVSPYIGRSTYERHKANRSESRERFTLLAKNKKNVENDDGDSIIFVVVATLPFNRSLSRESALGSQPLRCGELFALHLLPPAHLLHELIVRFRNFPINIVPYLK